MAINLDRNNYDGMTPSEFAEDVDKRLKKLEYLIDKLLREVLPEYKI